MKQVDMGGIATALIAALLFGASPPLAKLLLVHTNPWLLAALLYLGSGLGLLLLRRLSELENVYLKTSAFYALGEKSPPYLDLADMIERVLKDFGSQRLMWGSDAPYQVEKNHTYHDSIELIRSRIRSLTDSDKANLLEATAHKVFFSN